MYNSSYNKPKVEGRDDVTGEKLSKRPDDTPEIFSRRLDLYNKETFPLLHYCETQLASSKALLELTFHPPPLCHLQTAPTTRTRSRSWRAQHQTRFGLTSTLS